MPKRPEAHVTGDMAQTRVRQRFEDAGYAVNELARDYGEDLLVRVFERERATPYAFLVQSKGSRHRRIRPTHKNGVLGYSVRLSNDHLKLWRDLALPVVVTYWDATAAQIFWAFVPTERHTWPPEPAKRPRASLHIPFANKLDAHGLNKIRVAVTERHALIRRQAECIRVLIDLLQTETALRNITADPQGEWIEYDDPRESPRSHIILTFGAHAKLQTLVAEYHNRRSNVGEYVAELYLDATQNALPRDYEFGTMTAQEKIALARRKIRRKQSFSSTQLTSRRSRR